MTRIRRLTHLFAKAPEAARAPRHQSMAIVWIVVFALSASCVSQESQRTFQQQSGVLWEPYQSWSITMPSHDGNPFDVVADVTFSHASSGDVHRTQMYFAGNDRWSFRFTGTRTGTWSFVTASEHDELDGWQGQVRVASSHPSAHTTGFLTTEGTRFAAPSDEDGTLVARLYNVYMSNGALDSLHNLPSEREPLLEAIEAILDEVEAHGMDAVFVAMNNNWFSFGADRYDDHDSENPSPTSFTVLETLILSARARGLSVHIWAWGDEERRWTPIEVGGVNGEPDRRLQRYIAARLGPLPGWTMSYGFDLDEWLTPEQARKWADYLHDHMGWRHLLMARETPSEWPPTVRRFDFGADKLDVHSSDDRPVDDFYATAVAAIEAAPSPVLFERRFLHTRDDVWDMDATRRALWQFTLAGGAGAIWGPMWSGEPAYPQPEQLRTHQRFWRDRWSLDLQPLVQPQPPDNADAYVLHDAEGARTIVYAESTTTLRLDLSGSSVAQPAVAIDTRTAYAEIALGQLQPVDQNWTAPYPSDWVVAIGGF